MPNDIANLGMFTRQNYICPPDSLPEVCMVGAGHLGSMIALGLAQIGVGTRKMQDNNTPIAINTRCTNQESTNVNTVTASKSKKLTLEETSTLPSASIVERVWMASWKESLYSSIEEAIDDAGIIIFDDDVVNLHNVAASYFTYDQALEKEPKVKALIHNINTLMDVNMLGIQSQVPSDFVSINQITKPVLILSTDSRRSRKLIWNILQRNNPGIELLIDARSGWDVTRIFTCIIGQEDDEERYTKSLEPEGQDVPCSARAVAYNSMGVAANVSAILKSYYTGGSTPHHVMQDYKTWTNITQV